MEPELVPIDVIIETSVPSLCSVDYKKVMKDPQLSKDGKIKTDLCDKYPQKCDKASAEYDACAADWTACLLNIDFHMCVHFQETCFGAEEMFGPQSEEFSTFAELSQAICNIDKDLYCRGTDTVNVVDVCAEADSLPFEIMGGTALGSLCDLADFEYMCKDLKLCEPDLPKNLCERFGAGEVDERCQDPA